MSKEIRAAVDAYLKEQGITFTANYGGETRRDGSKSDRWQVEFFKAGRQPEVFDYYMGEGRRKPEKVPGAHVIGNGYMPEQGRMYAHPPTATDVVYALTADAQAGAEPFTDFCMTYGYDTDSRKALEIYLACQDTGARLRRAIGAEAVDHLAELVQEY